MFVGWGSLAEVFANAAEQRIFPLGLNLHDNCGESRVRTACVAVAEWSPPRFYSAQNNFWQKFL